MGLCTGYTKKIWGIGVCLKSLKLGLYGQFNHQALGSSIFWICWRYWRWCYFPNGNSAIWRIYREHFFRGGRKENPGCLWNSIHAWLRMSSRNAADEWCCLPMKDAACDTRGRSALAHRSNSRSLVGNSILMFTHDQSPEYGEIWVVSIHTSWYTSSFYCFVFVPFFGWLTSEGWLGVVGHFFKLQGARDPCFIALWILKRHRICGDLGLQWWISVDCVTIGYSTR